MITLPFREAAMAADDASVEQKARCHFPSLPSPLPGTLPWMRTGPRISQRRRDIKSVKPIIKVRNTTDDLFGDCDDIESSGNGIDDGRPLMPSSEPTNPPAMLARSAVAFTVKMPAPGLMN